MPKFFLYDESMQNIKAKITTTKLATMGDVVAPEKAYIYAVGENAPTTLKIMGGVLLSVSNSIFKTIDTTLTAANLDTGTTFTVGTDYYIYICDPTVGDETKDEDEVYKISKSSTFPSGFTAVSSRKIGGFHYGVVRRVNENGNPVNSSGAERGSGWESCTYNGILPNSVYTLLHRPKCEPSGMAYIGNGLWADIYVSSDDGEKGLQSIFNEKPITGTEGINWYIANEKAHRVGKRLPTYAEFCQAAYGSPQGLDDSNTFAWSSKKNTGVTQTGVVNYAVSALNIRDLVGNAAIWVNEFCLDSANSSGEWQNVLGSGHGQAYIPDPEAIHMFVCGGTWNSGNHAGDRTIDYDYAPWDIVICVGVWCVCDSQ